MGGLFRGELILMRFSVVSFECVLPCSFKDRNGFGVNVLSHVLKLADE